MGEDSITSGINSVPDDSGGSGANSGAVYLFLRSGGVWVQRSYLKASNSGMDDGFGRSVGLAGDLLAVGADGEAGGSIGVDGDQADNSAPFRGAGYLFGTGGVLVSTSFSGGSAPGGVDLGFGEPGYAAISPTGEILLESGLIGSGASGGRNRAMFSTIGGGFDMVLQTGTVVSGLAGLPTGAKISSISAPIHNRSDSLGIFQATATGTGITTSNNRLLMKDNGAYVSAIRRTGVPVTELGGALPSAWKEVVQGDEANDRIGVVYTLKTAVAGVNSTNDTGLLLMDHGGVVDRYDAREGNASFGAPGGSVPGALGQFGRVAVCDGDDFYFTAKFIPTGGKPVDALYHIGGSTGRNIPLQGESAGDTTAGEKYGVFTGISRIGTLGLLRATMTGSPAATNEGVWNSGGGLLLRKGQDIGGGAKITKLIRIWGVNNGQVLAQVVLGGTGVTTANNQALLLRRTDGVLQTLIRSGQAAPGLGLDKVTVGGLQAVDVEPVKGYYVVLGSLKGVATTANQALWWGKSSAGDDGSQQHRRLPFLYLQKGGRFHTSATSSMTIRGLALKPAPDASGVGGRGFAQIVNEDGEFLVIITGDRGTKTMVRLTP